MTIRDERQCACGCKVSFTINSTSRKIYLNKKHSQHARDLRRKLKLAGVAYA